MKQVFSGVVKYETYYISVSLVFGYYTLLFCLKFLMFVYNLLFFVYRKFICSV